MSLNPKRRAFVEEYLRCWNASEAARRAGYRGRPDSIGSRLLGNVSIQAAIQARLSELAMSADEVLTRLADQARGSMEDFIGTGEDGTVIGLDFAKAKTAGKLHLIRAVAFGKDSDRLELYDAQAALVRLGEGHGLFAKRIDLRSGNKPLSVREVIVNLASHEIDAEPVEG